jgi:hypothetical protein
MTSQTLKNTKPVNRISLSWLKISIGATLTFMILLVLLHFIKAELDPSWRMISEYAIGKHGWIMVIAFLIWALAYASLFFSIRSQIQGLSGKIGLALLLISSLGLLIAGIFVTDPITVSREEATTSGMLHGLGGSLGLAMPFSAVLVSWALLKNPNWVPVRKAVLWSAVLAVTGFLISIISIIVLFSQNNGVAGPSVTVGYPMRFEAFTYCIWLIVVARQAAYLRKQLNWNR